MAALPVLAEYCLPLLRRGGVFIAMKGSGADEEIDAAQGAVAKLGGKYAGRQDVTLPDGSARTLILYEKYRKLRLFTQETAAKSQKPR